MANLYKHIYMIIFEKKNEVRDMIRRLYHGSMFSKMLVNWKYCSLCRFCYWNHCHRKIEKSVGD